MAHFAELDDNNRVKRVIVVSNNDTSDAYGTEKESIGIAFCEKLFGGRWIQTSYNGNFRNKYAGIGDIYNPTLDAFIPPKPFPSWLLNTQTYQWEAPVPYPQDGNTYKWNESNRMWVLSE